MAGFEPICRIPPVVFILNVVNYSEGRRHSAQNLKSLITALQQTKSGAKNPDISFHSPTQSLLGSDAIYLAKMNAALRDRAFFVTENGTLCVGPSNVLVGDRVCMFNGARVPSVVRELGIEGYFTLVGEAYVHGLMYGEIETNKDGIYGEQIYRLR
jgi:hypothetical protein